MMHFQKRFDVPAQAPQFEPQSIELGRILHQSRRLGGGFRHQNHQVWFQGDPMPYVLRLGEDPLWMTIREAKLCALAQKHVHTPTCLDHGEFEHGSWSIYQWIEGVSMDEVLASHPGEDWSTLFRECGQWLARIHQMRFETGGFFDINLNIPEPVANMSAHFWAYMTQCIQQQRVQTRMGTLATALSRQLSEYKKTLEAQPNVLVHSDFNTKNIMLTCADGQWRVRAIMDWEFAYAGVGLCDLGNFLRFEEDVERSMRNCFIEGYQQNHTQPLIHHWRSRALWYDMTSLLSMLDRPSLGVKTQQTVIDKIQEYMEKLA